MDPTHWAANIHGSEQVKTFLKSTTAIVTLMGAMALMTGTAEARNVHAGAKHEISQVKQDKADAKVAAEQARAAAKQAKADAKAAAKQAKADAKAAAKQAKADAAGIEDDDTVSSDDQGDDVDVADETDAEGVDD